MDGTVYNWRNDQLLPGRRATTEEAPIFAKLATTDRDHGEAQELRYDAYSAAGYLRESETGRFCDKYDNSSANKTFVLYRGKIPVASARVCLLNRTESGGTGDTIPAYEMFQSEIDSYMAASGHATTQNPAIEVTRLSRHSAFSRDIAIMQAMFRMIGYLVLHFDASVMFAAVTTNHVPFYRRMGFQLVADPRDYPGLDVKTALMGCGCHDHSPVRGHLSSLSTLSKHDNIYKSFMAGQIFPVPRDPLADLARTQRQPPPSYLRAPQTENFVERVA